MRGRDTINRAINGTEPRLLTNPACEHESSRNWIADLRRLSRWFSATNAGTMLTRDLRGAGAPYQTGKQLRGKALLMGWGLPVVNGVSLLVLLIAAANVMNLPLLNALKRALLSWSSARSQNTSWFQLATRA